MRIDVKMNSREFDSVTESLKKLSSEEKDIKAKTYEITNNAFSCTIKNTDKGGSAFIEVKPFFTKWACNSLLKLFLSFKASFELLSDIDIDIPVIAGKNTIKIDGVEVKPEEPDICEVNDEDEEELEEALV